MFGVLCNMYSCFGFYFVLFRNFLIMQNNMECSYRIWVATVLLSNIISYGCSCTVSLIYWENLDAWDCMQPHFIYRTHQSRQCSTSTKTDIDQRKRTRYKSEAMHVSVCISGWLLTKICLHNPAKYATVSFCTGLTSAWVMKVQELCSFLKSCVP